MFRNVSFRHDFRVARTLGFRTEMVADSFISEQKLICEHVEMPCEPYSCSCRETSELIYTNIIYIMYDSDIVTGRSRTVQDDFEKLEGQLRRPTCFIDISIHVWAVPARC